MAWWGGVTALESCAAAGTGDDLGISSGLNEHAPICVAKTGNNILAQAIPLAVRSKI